MSEKKLSQVHYGGLAKAALKAQAARRFLLLYGKAGTGKTAAGAVIHTALTGRTEDGAISHQEWREGESGYAVVNCVGQSPDSMTGFLVPDHDTRDGWFTKPEHWPIESVVGDAHITICVDEIDKFSKDAISTLLGLLDANRSGHKYLGTHRLGKNVNIYFTANGKEHGSQESRVLSNTLVNRCYLREFVEDVTSWAEGFAKPEGLDVSPVYHWLVGYGHEWFCPKTSARPNGEGIATPRSWEAACRLVTWETPYEEALWEDLNPLVGHDAALACASFIELIEKNKGGITKLKAGKLDLATLDNRDQYAVLTGALRTIPMDYDSEEEIDAALAGTELDWLIKGLSDTEAELRQWALSLAKTLGVNIKIHSEGAKFYEVAA